MYKLPLGCMIILKLHKSKLIKNNVIYLSYYYLQIKKFLLYDDTMIIRQIQQPRVYLHLGDVEIQLSMTSLVVFFR